MQASDVLDDGLDISHMARVAEIAAIAISKLESDEAKWLFCILERFANECANSDYGDSDGD